MGQHLCTTGDEKKRLLNRQVSRIILIMSASSDSLNPEDVEDEP
jgi:hypothetical protein